MKNRGFTLVELVIAMFIITIILTLSSQTFRSLIMGANSQKNITETELGKIIGTEMIRLDLEHVGFGIASNEANLPMAWDGTTLTLRSTINNGNAGTIGWLLLNCTVGSVPTVIVDRRQDTTVNTAVLLSKDKQFVANQSIAAQTTAQCLTCQDLNTNLTPANNYIASAYPYVATVSDGCSTATGGQYCNIITYSISTTNTLTKCATGTRNLLRRVGGDALNGTGGDRILECVADIQIRFDWDLNNDGDLLDAGEVNLTTIPVGSTTSDIISSMKNIDMYVLMQSGAMDPNYTFSGDLTMNGALPAANAADGFNTAAVTNFSQYRWKVLKVSAKPMSW
ncbi:prepilin-type N-terminal cleavage/methylation domain-containing protein [Desulfocapsa sulfexigens DSM 10523]|uniref:Prepilin-type N-terminal cleavage/methylation domain-containing protein n=1 Tax=Desulfocapsa sulfexigens (strain DSM 10523 / SB164P1) TaxID=1167006 RepID=M1P5P3_DESSD|nr:prepilin-type N-terminal cleavage/methylation domain-containing protein [Desulfocapsa sulfexigens]AGF78818.1 prepilin-type N-terminal cleavage/methylation domain-containing protein [Desulfocapsa sulfexigens DSM 10523]